MRSEIEIRPATNSDFIRFYGIQPPDTWGGLAAVRDRLVLGVAGVLLRDGNYWGFVDAAPSVRSPARFHRRALRYLQQLAVDEVRVQCDDRFARARTWLARLGFIETDEELNGCKVWIRKRTNGGS